MKIIIRCLLSTHKFNQGVFYKQTRQDIRETATDNTTTRTTNTINRIREDFMNQLTNFGAYRNPPPIQRMSDPQKLEEMRRKMEQHTQENDDPKR